MQQQESVPLKDPPSRKVPSGSNPPKQAVGDGVELNQINVRKQKQQTADTIRMAGRNKLINDFVAPTRSRIEELQRAGKLPDKATMEALASNPSYVHQFTKASIVGDQAHNLKVRFANWTMTFSDFWRFDVVARIGMANQALDDIFCNQKAGQAKRISISKHIKNPENPDLPNQIMFAFVVCLFGCEWLIWRTADDFKSIRSKAGISVSLPENLFKNTKEGASTNDLNAVGIEVEEFLAKGIQEVSKPADFETLMEFFGISRSFCETRCLRILEVEVSKESAGRQNDGCFSKCIKSICGGWKKRWFGIGYNAVWYYENFNQKAENLRDSIYLDQDSNFTIKNISKAGAILRLRLNRRILILKVNGLARALNTIQAVMQAFVESTSTKSHQFGSFAPLRTSNAIDFHIRGQRYFETMERLIKDAKYEIMICDWIFSPEFPLTRPLPSGSNLSNAQNRILELLKDAAVNRNVNIYILLYKEFKIALYNDSGRAKEIMERLTPVTKKIKVICHNEKFGSLWSHHEKLVIVDRHFALMGGFDIAWGRWDNHEVPLFDYTKDSSLFPGYDYYNPFNKELIKVEGNDYLNKLTPSNIPRMPWQDLGISIKGPSVYDLLTHFMTYWNNARELTVEDEEVLTGHILLQQLRLPHIAPGELYRLEAAIVKDGNSESNAFASCCKRIYKEDKQPEKQKANPPTADKKAALRSNTDYVPGPAAEEDGSHDESDETLSYSFDYSTDPSDDEIPSPVTALEGPHRTTSQPPVAVELTKGNSKFRSNKELHDHLDHGYQRAIDEVKKSIAGTRQKGVWLGEVISQKHFAEDNKYTPLKTNLNERAVFIKEDVMGEATPQKPGDTSQREMRKAETAFQAAEKNRDFHAAINSSFGAGTELLAKLKQINPKLQYLFHGLRDVPLHEESPVTYQCQDGVPQIPFEVPEGFFKAREGNMSAQVLRSASPWSIGLQQSEHSIYNAYIELIMASKHFIYIENQFFMSYAPDSPVNKDIKNSVARALFLRIKKAHDSKQPFKVIVFIPLLPANEGDLETRGNKQTQVMVAIQNFTIGEGKGSLYESIRGLGANPEDYIMFGSLRTWAYAPSTQTDPANPNRWLPDLENPKTELIYIHSKVVSLSPSV